MIIKTGTIYGSNVHVGDVWLRGDVRIPVETIKIIGGGRVLINGLWAWCPVDRYRVERTV